MPICNQMPEQQPFQSQRNDVKSTYGNSITTPKLPIANHRERFAISQPEQYEELSDDQESLGSAESFR